MASLDRAFGGDEDQSGLKGKTVLCARRGRRGPGDRSWACSAAAPTSIIASRTTERADDLAGFCKGKSIGWGHAAHRSRPT